MRIAYGAICFTMAFGLLSYNQSEHDEWLERKVERMAQELEAAPENVKQTRFGRYNARADGAALIVTLNGAPSGNDVQSPDGYRYGAYAIACDGGPIETLLEEGARFRFEVITNTGKELEPLEIGECS